MTLEQYLRSDFRESLIPAHLGASFSRLVDYISGSQLPRMPT